MIGRRIVLYLPGCGKAWSECFEREGRCMVSVPRTPYETLRILQTAQPRYLVTSTSRAGIDLLRSAAISTPGVIGIAVGRGDLHGGTWPRTLGALLVEGDAGDVLQAMEAIERRPFGVERHMEPADDGDLRVWRTTVRRSSEREAALDWIEGTAAGEAGLAPRTTRRLLELGDELLTNGLYNAPVDFRGEPRFRHLPRPHDITLAEHEALTLTLAVTATEAALSAADPFGSLSPDVALRHLVPALTREKGSPRLDEGGGAGLGLFKSYRAVGRLVISIEENRRTEVTGILSRRRAYGDRSGREQSLWIFVKEAEKCRID